jgi:tetratricopeptide (TPR) repeat protein
MIVAGARIGAGQEHATMALNKRWSAVLAALAISVAGPAMAQAAADDAMANDAARSDAMYEYLVAEFAAQRGDIDGALAIYQRLAKQMRDPAIARRAVETAIKAREFGPALESATLLLELDPESTLAREIMAALLANDGDLKKAQGLIETILAKSTDRAGVLMQLSHLFAKFPDKPAVLDATQAATRPYEAMGEARYANGVAALIAGRNDVASSEADAALAAKPGWEPAASPCWRPMSVAIFNCARTQSPESTRLYQSIASS